MASLADRIVDWIREQVKEAKSEGGVVGLSGGIDSAVVGALTKRALGESIVGVLLPCHSLPEDAEMAHLVARTFDIEVLTIDLASAYDALLATLPEGSRLAKANLKPRLRMAALYYVANARNYLVVGTGNRTEIMVGYFTKYGDGGVDILPIGGLHKSEVRQLAKELGVPQPVIDRPPSAGLWEGQTDEGELGITYEELERILRAFDTGEDLSKFDDALVSKVVGMIRRSEHKRVRPPIFTP